MRTIAKFIITAVALSTASLYAEIKLPKIFSDNMLLQREIPAKIWGTADANAKVDVEFAGQKKSATADDDGSWSVSLDPLKADKTPREIKISENGKPAKQVKNVLVGEVWILGGQSNMQWNVENSTDASKAKARAKYPALRYFSQNTRLLSKTPLKDTESGAWKETTPETVGGYSAVGFYFGEQLMKDLDVPVGLVFAALGGSKMIAWIPEDKVRDAEYTKADFENFLKNNAGYSYDKAVAKWKENHAKWVEDAKAAKAVGKKPARGPVAPNKVSYYPEQRTPVYLYNAVVAHLAGFAARGVLWYQGESDSGGDCLKNFNEQFDLVAKSWREKFGNDDLAFVCVQLASFKHPNDWALTRWKQYLASKSTPKVYMANIIDCGEELDIHPKDKTTVGARLENIARAEIYGVKGLHPYGPIFKTVKYTPDSATVLFDLDGRKLVGKGDPRGFELKIDGEWKPAKAELAGNAVKLSPTDSDKNKKIGGVRYLWKSWAQPDVWLFNQDGLPALSFISEK